MWADRMQGNTVYSAIFDGHKWDITFCLLMTDSIQCSNPHKGVGCTLYLHCLPYSYLFVSVWKIYIAWQCSSVYQDRSIVILDVVVYLCISDDPFIFAGNFKISVVVVASIRITEIPSPSLETRRIFLDRFTVAFESTVINKLEMKNIWSAT